jgi:protein SCO1/2
VRKLAVGLAAIALAAFGAGALIASKQSPDDVIASLPDLPKLKPFEGEREIAPFSLTDHHGQPFERERLLGRWTLVTFGFTSCPDACPTMLTNLAELRKSLLADWHGPEPQFVLVSVDPARDTQAVLAKYVPAFDHAFLGVTGTQAAIDRMHADLGGAHRIAPRKPNRADGKVGDQYSVDHSVLLYVINPDGRLHAQIAPPFDPAGVAGQIGRFAQAFLATKAAVTAASQQGVR